MKWNHTALILMAVLAVSLLLLPTANDDAITHHRTLMDLSATDSMPNPQGSSGRSVTLNRYDRSTGTIRASETACGTDTVVITNDPSDTGTYSGMLSLSIDDGYAIDDLGLEVLSAEATEHYIAGQGIGTGFAPSRLLAAGGTRLALAQEFNLTASYRVDSVELNLREYDRGAYPPEILYIDLLRANESSDLPSTNSSDVLAQNATDIDVADLSVYTWYPFGLGGSFLLNASDPYYVSVNASRLGGAYPNADLIYMRTYDDILNGDQGTMAAFGASGWSDDGGYDMCALLVGTRVGPDNTTWWAPSAQALVLNATVDGVAQSFDSDNETTHTDVFEPGGEGTTVDIDFEGTEACILTIHWHATLILKSEIPRAATEAEEESADEEAEDDKDSQEAEKPWMFATEEDWLLASMSLLTLAVVLLALIHGRTGLLWALVFMFAFAASWMLVSLRWSDWMLFYVETVNDITMRYGWYIFWQGAIAISGSVWMASVQTAPKGSPSLRTMPKNPRRRSKKEKMWNKRTKIGLGSLAVAGIILVTWFFLSWAARSYLVELVRHQNYVIVAVRTLADDVWARTRRFLW